MDQTIQIINRVLPILLLLSLGIWIRQKNFLIDKTIDELRKVVVNIALPAVLFISFLNIELKAAYFVIFLVMFFLCVGLFFLGKLLRKIFQIQYSYFPYLITGFEYGMLAVSLFGAAYGLDKIGYIAVADLGHEIFIWFVFLPLLLVKRDGAQKPKELIKSFLSTPVVIAILSSLILNFAGASQSLYQLPITGGVMTTLAFLSNLTVPLILIIVGYGVKIDIEGLKEALIVVAIRLAIMIPFVSALNAYLIKNILHLDKFFEIAMFTLLIMPPPFIVPLYASKNLDIGEKSYINNVLTVHTIISVLIFLVYFILNPLALG
jgi:predicted permease